MEWLTVYDFANDSIRSQNIFMPLIFVLIGLGILFFYKFNKSSKKKNRIFGLVYTLFSILFCIIVIPHQINDFHLAKSTYENANYTVIEGVVTDFDPMPYAGHQNESFTINDVRFEYSDFDESYYGFNNTKSHGGPIDEGRKIRVSYYINNKKNIIIKIEVLSRAYKQGSVASCFFSQKSEI